MLEDKYDPSGSEEVVKRILHDFDNIEKRGQLYGTSKRARMDEVWGTKGFRKRAPYGFGIGKRAPYNFGIGK